MSLILAAAMVVVMDTMVMVAAIAMAMVEVIIDMAMVAEGGDG